MRKLNKEHAAFWRRFYAAQRIIGATPLVSRLMERPARRSATSELTEKGR